MRSYRLAALCPSPSWGGLEMNALRNSVWLRERGHDVTLLVFPGSELERRAALEQIRCRPFRSTGKVGDLALVGSLIRDLAAVEAEMLLVYLNRNLPLAAMTKAFSARPLKLVYMQNMHVGGTKRDPFHTAVHRWFDLWVAPLPMLRELVRQKTRIADDKLVVIPFGAELERFTDRLPPQADARAALHLPLDRTTVGVIGRLDFKKGQHILLEAAGQLRRRGFDFEILLVGEETVGEGGAYTDRLHRLIDEQGLVGRVHVRSFRPDVETAFSALDIFTLTSKSETFGMVTIEAMASGKAVIGSAEGGTIDLIQDGITGLLVPPFDSAALAGALEKLLADPDLRCRLAQTAREYARREYSHLRQVERLEAEFDRIAGADDQSAW